MSELPKMCPDCMHRCLAPQVILGDTSCDHCKAVRQARAEVLAACIEKAKQIKSTRLYGTSKNSCQLIIDALKSIQPAASDLEELLRKERLEERLCVLAEHPGLCNGDTDNPERHARLCKYHQELSELEKARATEEKR